MQEIHEEFLQGGAGLNKGHAFRDPRTGTDVTLPETLNDIAARIAPAQATTTALGALTSDYRADGRQALVLSDNSQWRFNAASTAGASANVVVPADNPTTGRWIRIIPGVGATVVVGASVATTAALTAIAGGSRAHGETITVEADNSTWQFDSVSSATASGVVLAPDVGTGRWLRTDKEGAVRILAAPATTAALTAITAANRYTGMIAVVAADNSMWQFDSGSSATASTGLVLSPDAGTGRWLRVGCNEYARPADLTALKAIAAANRFEGMFAVLKSNGSTWRFAATSTLTGEDFLVASPAAGTGKWLRVDKVVDLVFPIDETTADATALYTVPTGFVLGVDHAFWHVTDTMTTGSAGAAGLSSSNTGLNVKGDILGGATGDLVATLVSTGVYAKGTIGAKMNGRPGLVIIGGETIRYDLIAGTYTGGDMEARVRVCVLVAPAA